MMDDKKIYELHAEIGKTLANPKRLEILNLLKTGELCVDDLASKMGLAKSNVSQHLAVMRSKGILVTRRDGVNIYYSVANKKVLKALEIIREVLVEKLTKNQALAEKIRDEK